MQRNKASQGGEQRPSVLTDLSTTQMDELERHFTEGNHQAWNTLIETYGWTADQGQAVWDWFGQDPEGGQGSSSTSGSQSSTADSYATDSQDSVPAGGTGTGATSSMGSGTGHVAQHGSGGGTGEVH